MMHGGRGWIGVMQAGSTMDQFSTLSPNPESPAEERTQCLESGIMGSGIKIKADTMFSVLHQTSMVRVLNHFCASENKLTPKVLKSSKRYLICQSAC